MITVFKAESRRKECASCNSTAGFRWQISCRAKIREGGAYSQSLVLCARCLRVLDRAITMEPKRVDRKKLRLLEEERQRAIRRLGESTKQLKKVRTT